MDELIYQGSYTEFKEELKGELRKSAESFVKIGYLLKVARDTDILKTSGYSGLEDFARAEFDLDKSQVSRFIRINDRFSENGNSDRLTADYADFGVRKLSLMLTLPDEINEELSPSYTVNEIESIKQTYEEEQAVTPIEDYMEQQEAKQEENKAAVMAEEDMLEAVIYQIGHDSPETFAQMYSAKNLLGETDLFSALAPGGESSHKVRIKGVGALLMACDDKTITITNMRTLGKEYHTWEEANKAFNALVDMNNASGMCPKAAWEAVYGESLPEKSEVAPVQQTQKQSKVVDHIKKEPEKVPETQTGTLREPISEEKTEKEEKIEEENAANADRDVTGTDFEEEKEEAPEEAKETTPEVIEAAVIEEPIMNPPVEKSGKTAEEVFSDIELSHDDARRYANNIYSTIGYGSEELSADDVKEMLRRVEQLKKALEEMLEGYTEYEAMTVVK